MPLYGKEHEWEVRLYEKYDKTGRKYFMGQIFTTYDTKNKKVLTFTALSISKTV